MWHIHWDQQNYTNTNACPGAQALARQTQHEVWWPIIVAWPEATWLASAAISAERCFATLLCRNSISLTSLLSQAVCDLCWVHAQKICLVQRVKQDLCLEVSLLYTYFLSCKRELMVSVLYVILHKYPPPTEWYVKVGLHLYFYFLVSYGCSLVWTGITINH